MVIGPAELCATRHKVVEPIASHTFFQHACAQCVPCMVPQSIIEYSYVYLELHYVSGCPEPRICGSGGQPSTASRIASFDGSSISEDEVKMCGVGSQHWSDSEILRTNIGLCS